MSQANNHVKWCLNKAKKELAEGRKHRGLVETIPNLNNAIAHVEKAEHNFKAITYFSVGGFSDWSVSAAFYVVYHCLLGILAKFGYESRNQECTLSAIQYLKETGKIELDKKFVTALLHQEQIKEKHENTVIELREDYQYGVQKEIESKDKIGKLVQICKEMLDVTKEIIYQKK